MVLALVERVCVYYPRKSDDCRRDATPFIAQQPHAQNCCALRPIPTAAFPATSPVIQFALCEIVAVPYMNTYIQFYLSISLYV